LSWKDWPNLGKALGKVLGATFFLFLLLAFYGVFEPLWRKPFPDFGSLPGLFLRALIASLHHLLFFLPVIVLSVLLTFFFLANEKKRKR
jgi:hypothetical protein